MGRICNFILIELNIVEISNTNRISNKNIQCLEILLEYLTVLRYLAGTVLPASFMRVCFVKFIRLSNVSDFIL